MTVFGARKFNRQDVESAKTDTKVVVSGPGLRVGIRTPRDYRLMPAASSIRRSKMPPS
jgi:hypothetical protein